MSQSTYVELDESLDAAASEVAAAEAHGSLCGALCTEASYAAAQWATDLLGEDADAATALPLASRLQPIRDATLASLTDGEMRFQPALPDDEAPLDERVRALAAWCAGFLYGIGRSGMLQDASAELNEILADFSEISRAGLTAGEGGEAAERDYVELVEFVRAAAQLAFEETAGQRIRRTAARSDRH